MNRRPTPVEWLVFLALGGAWGSSYLFIKIAVETITPFTLVAGRLAIGVAVLALVMLVTRQAMPRHRSAYLHLLVVAVLGIVVPFSLISWGEQSIDSALAAVLNGTVPLFAIVLAALVLADEPITINRLAGLAIGFAGVVVLTAPGIQDGVGGSLAGQLALIGSAISYAAAGVYARRTVKGVPALTSAFLEVGFAFVITLALTVVFGSPWVTRLELDAVLSVVWLGLIGSGLAFLAFFFLLNRWGATRTALVAYLLPVVGIVLGAVILSEEITLAMVAGTALIIGGIALANSRYGHKRLLGRSPGPSVQPTAD
ncbi:MAG TPA: DMT family transporter [Candidatus Limnocylindria bacterium]|nr:DMT family transporter [Candidatus Limnocylindria bacterium]